jgi:hypothetical protein
MFDFCIKFEIEKELQGTLLGLITYCVTDMDRFLAKESIFYYDLDLTKDFGWVGTNCRWYELLMDFYLLTLTF